MSSETTPNQQNSALTRVTALASAFSLVPILVGNLAQLVVKAVNPDDVDVSQPLAYLRPLLIFSFTVAGFWFAFVIAAVMWLQRREGPAVARLPWLVVGVQIVLGLVVLALQLGINSVIER